MKILLCAISIVTAITPALAEVVIYPPHSNVTFNNPLKGWCPYTDNEIKQPYSMVFLYAPWKTLEPEKGKYAFKEWESCRVHGWAHPRANGKRIVFRVVVDMPEDEDSRFGIPNWLKSEVGLHEYQVYGGGESPEYCNAKFVAAITRFIGALGNRYDECDRVAFIELGILGHWGEWHVHKSFPVKFKIPDTTKEAVLNAYHMAFKTKKLMCRNASGPAADHEWLGYHDDMFPEDTGFERNWYFLKNLTDGGRQDNWSVAPFGGEMVPDNALKWLGNGGFRHTMAMAQQAHFTWVGPYSPASEFVTNMKYQRRCDQLLRTMGYRFRLESIRHSDHIVAGEDFSFVVEGRNVGVAPFYYDWPIVVSLIDKHGDARSEKTLSNVDLRKWQSMQDFTFSVDLPTTGLKPANGKAPYEAGDVFRLALGVRDPWTKELNMRFANDLPVFYGWTVLSTVKMAE